MTSAEDQIFLEVKAHSVYWKSDMAKRITVEKHLMRKIPDVVSKVDALIKQGRLILIPKPRGDYLTFCKNLVVRFPDATLESDQGRVCSKGLSTSNCSKEGCPERENY